MTTDKYLIRQARRAWDDAAPLRVARRRLKAFAYGRQWGDTTVTPDGRRLTEEQRAREEGSIPVTNNIIRRMVKSIIGHYRHLAAAETRQSGEAGSAETSAAFSPFAERDARALEELLISGVAVQRVGGRADIVNVSPERFIFRRFLRTDGSDCRLLGMLHDIPLDEVLRRFSDRSPDKALRIKDAYRDAAGGAAAPFPLLSAAPAAAFATPTMPGTVRVVEVWEHACVELLRVHDPEKADYSIVPADRYDELRRAADRRVKKGRAPLKISYDVAQAWIGRWMTPEGLVLASEEAAHHPFVMRFYPMIDGEVHSAVEDVIDQQKLINRLVSTLDRIIAATAKGVLLYPADQLPDGFTWKDVRRIWSNPSGILPFKRTSSTLMPHQVNTTGTGSGANELLRTQLELFDEISGATGAFRGRSDTAAGEGMLRAEMENSLISMLDILNSFHEFIVARDTLVNAQCAARDARPEGGDGYKNGGGHES